MEDTMQLRKTLPFILLIAIFLLAACSTATPAQDVMMNKEPTATEMMMAEDEMPAATATLDTMMEDKDDQAMIDENENMADDDMSADESMPAGDDMSADESMKDNDMADSNMAADDMSAGDEMSSTDDGMMSPEWFSIELTNITTGEVFSLNDYAGKVVLVENMAQWCSNCKKQQDQVLALTDQIGEVSDVVLVALDIDPNEDGQSLKAYTAGNGYFWNYAVAPAELSRQIGQELGDQFLNPPSTPMFIIDRHGDIHPLGFGIKSADDLYDAVQQFLNDDM